MIDDLPLHLRPTPLSADPRRSWQQNNGSRAEWSAYHHVKQSETTLVALRTYTDCACTTVTVIAPNLTILEQLNSFVLLTYSMDSKRLWTAAGWHCPLFSCQVQKKTTIVFCKRHETSTGTEFSSGLNFAFFHLHSVLLKPIFSLELEPVHCSPILS